MPMAIKEQVFGLQISVDDVLRMQVLDSQGRLGSVKLGNGIGEALDIE